MPDTAPAAPRSAELYQVVWSRCAPSPLNPRKHVDAARLDELVESVRAKGVLQNLVVRPAGDDYEIVAGESRWLAVKALVEAGAWPETAEIPVRVEEVDDRGLVEIALAENLQRRDLTPLEEAKAFQALRGYGATTAEIAARIGKTARFVQLRMALVEKTTEEVRAALADGKINPEQARMLTRVEPARQNELLEGALPDEDGDRYLDTAEKLAAAVSEDLVPVDAALFDRALYKGEIIPADELGREFFADKAAFARLQARALKAKKAELAKRWAWVLEHQGSHGEGLPYGFKPAPEGAPKAGALIVTDDEGAVRVEEGVIETSNPKRGGTARSTASAKKDPDAYDHWVFARARRRLLTEALKAACRADPAQTGRLFLFDAWLFSNHQRPAAMAWKACAALSPSAVTREITTKLARTIEWPEHAVYAAGPHAVLAAAKVKIAWTAPSSGFLAAAGPAQLRAIAADLKCAPTRDAIAAAAAKRKDVLPIYLRTGDKEEWAKAEAAAKPAAPAPATKASPKPKTKKAKR